MQTKTYVVQRVHHISLVEWDNFLSPCARSLMSCQIGPSSQSFANLRSYGIKYDFLGTYKLAYNIRSAIAALFSAIFNWLVLWNRRWRHIHKVVFCCFIFRGYTKMYLVKVRRYIISCILCCGSAKEREWTGKSTHDRMMISKKNIFFLLCIFSILCKAVTKGLRFSELRCFCFELNIKISFTDIAFSVCYFTTDQKNRLYIIRYCNLSRELRIHKIHVFTWIFSFKKLLLFKKDIIAIFLYSFLLVIKKIYILYL